MQIPTFLLRKLYLKGSLEKLTLFQRESIQSTSHW
jgi:hypothetical protein